MTIVLGIDPGSNITGYGLISTDGSTLKFVACGCLNVKGDKLSDRLHQLNDDLHTLIRYYKPCDSAIERVFMNRYADSALKLGQARGAAIVALARNGLEVAEYAPRAIKQAVAGYGGADKDQIRAMITRLLGLDRQPSADAADALGVALCHAQHQMKVNALGRAR